MSRPSLPRAFERAAALLRLRPAARGAALAAVVGLTVGCAYMGGSAVKMAEVRAQAGRIDGIAAAGFTEEAFAHAAGGLDDSALTIARRHDPYTVAGDAQRDRRAAVLAGRLEDLRAPRQSMPGVAPFRIAGALDQSRDLECLTQAAYYEARGEGAAGMKAVVQVVLNRARHGAFPNTVCGVVFQGSNRRSGCQFSFTCSGAMRGAVNRAAWNRARSVAAAALAGQVYAPVGSATHFHTTAVSPGWRHSLVRVTQVGDHLFYRFGGRRGDRSTFAYAAQPSRPEAEPRLIQARAERPAPTAEPTTGEVSYADAVAAEPASAPAPTASPVA